MLRSFYQNRAAVVFIILAVALAGILSFRSLPIALYPQTAKPRIEVRLDRFLISRDHFWDLHGKVLESKFLALSRVSDVKGWYHDSSASWSVEFDWGVDDDEAKSKVEAVVNGIVLPSDWGKFDVFFARHSGRIFLSISSETRSSDELYDVLADRVKSRIEKMPGADFAFLSEPSSEYIRITLNPDTLLALNISPLQVEETIRANKYNRSLGALQSKAGIQFSVLTEKAARSVEALKNLVISERGSRPIRILDVADVEVLSETPDYLIRGNGQRGLIAGASPKPDVNIAKFCDEFEALVRQGVGEVGEDITVDVLVNPSNFIQDAVENLGQAVLIGMLIATIVIFLFLSSLAHTLVVAVAIPLSLLGGFSVMRLVGMELNLISLGAMALAVGMVVDGSVVVLENVVRHYREKSPRTIREVLDVTVAAVVQVRTAVTASLLTTVVVFTPLVFTAPLAYAVLGDLAKVIVCVLLISYLVTLFIVPPLLTASSGGRTKARFLGSVAGRFQRVIGRAESIYLGMLRRLFERRALRRGFFLAVFGLGALGLYLVLAQVHREVMAEPDSDKVWLVLNFDQQKEVKDSEDRIIPIEQVLAREFGHRMTHFFANVWMSGGAILCNLKDKGDLADFKKSLEDRFTNTPEIKYSVNKWNPSALRLPNPPVARIGVEGGSYDRKRQVLADIMGVVERVDGVGRVETLPSVHLENSFRLKFDDVQLAVWHGAQANQVQSSIESMIGFALSEKKVRKLQQGSESISVKLGFPKDYLTSSTALGNLLLRIDDDIYPVRHFAQIESRQNYSAVYTSGGEEEALIEVWQKESYSGSREELSKSIREAISAAPIEKKQLIYHPTETEIDENILSLLYALLFALALVWIVISLQFGKASDVAIIMIAIPLGLIGVAYSLYVFRSTLSVNSMLGMILLCGTAVNNSIIFLDFFNKSSAQDGQRPVTERLLDTARLRFRPILITTLTTILGMLPIALGFGHGGEILQPLGIAVCGGLGVSTCLTLFTIPTVICAWHRKVAV